ncbi:NAD-dependent epimerase/dehydratase family protein [Thermomonospora curvata]|uniref:NAD-dependent epimerase/dehydratase n=1 Tax=Thermomonospora curvata (strain ATCC 19995 / DSM 43183 / JCM 3096 / KCTC 9072 / NBRC 15933 / NCIMB 10081 / Henssen B9) TaxID=471852 RepID=D1A613_THECD|nr:NAD(P)-dependent oxidoreductase [Thermomonospora curvata]ACY98308.1 NAD-dependent epimerase/dehydratase [Thermomonospora curvata DSM 43183]
MAPEGSVLVLGGHGFVGRHVCAAFAQRGRRVIVAGRRPSPRPSQYPFVRMDLAMLSAAELAAELERLRPGIVINTVGSIWGRSAEEMWAAAALPTQRLISALSSLSFRPRLVHLGSVLEYGHVAPGTTVGPHTVPRPDTAYGRAKLAATETAVRAMRSGAVDGMVLRLANIAGPGAPAISLLGQVAERLAACVGRDEVAEVRLSPLSAYRDYVDVRDAAEAVIAAAFATEHVGVIVDIGRGEAIPVRSLVDLLIKLSGVPARVVEQGSKPLVPDWLQLDIRPAMRLLGWRPRRTIAESVRDYWADVRPSGVQQQTRA